MKKLLLLLLFIPFFTFSQDEQPYFNEWSISDVVKKYQEVKNEYLSRNPAETWFQDILESSSEVFSYQTNFVYNNNTRNTYYFNQSGEVTGYDQIFWCKKNEMNNILNEKKTELIQYDSNPEISENNVPFKNGTLLKPLNFNISFKDVPSYMTVSKYLHPIYNKRNTKIINYYYSVIVSLRPKKSANGYDQDYTNTDYHLFNLKDDDMKYNLKNYVQAFLLDIGTPDIYLLRDYNYDLFEYFDNHDYKLNNKDKHFINSFNDGHKNMCKIDFPDDSLCPKDIQDLKIILDYQTLDDNRIAYAVGTIFKNKEIRIVVDPKKISDASPSKRAYIMYHELFHSFGLIHGECGPMMFPYVEKEYTWRDFSKGKLEAFECFVKMRNYLNRVSN
jgi:hypothetical protein